ncbi:ATP-binding cassette domain-containing protein [Rhizorhabdus histidinilytica]|uniref:ATP-binding cassette domain-containing protein n=1 Tax=Rhizorhabdus histidinilytica TaxID=439228 RepID=UPI001ADC79B2|nr:ATP-binding cassette domain-containing protein [Rhizorhabdus histidinilytica]
MTEPERSIDRGAVPGVSTGDAALVIQTSGLSKSFDRRIVVDRVDLQIRSREIFGLIGPNGAGKSTLIKMLTTLLPPSAGSAPGRRL